MPLNPVIKKKKTKIKRPTQGKLISKIGVCEYNSEKKMVYGNER